MSTHSTSTTETTSSSTDLAPDAGSEADTDPAPLGGWAARCPRQFSPRRTARLENLVDRDNQAMPDPDGGETDES